MELESLGPFGGLAHALDILRRLHTCCSDDAPILRVRQNFAASTLEVRQLVDLDALHTSSIWHMLGAESSDNLLS